MKRLVLVAIAALSSPPGVAASEDTASWVEASFDDFIDGSFDSSGANLYVSAGGTLQMINRFDVNQDGYIDFFFGNTHDINHVEPVWIYYQDERKPVPLPSNGAFRLAAADLDGNGRLDLVVGNRDNNVSDEIDAYVYWGRGTGFSADDRVGLPAAGITDIAVADLDGDARPEIVFANDVGDVSFIYWNGPDGISWRDRTDLPTHRAKGIAVTDANRDGRPDLVFANGSNEAGGSFLYWGDGKSFVSSRPRLIETSAPTGVAAGDLDGDGWDDLVFTGADSSSYIYWGADAAFSYDTRTTLEVDAPGDSAIADVDGDGHLDILFPSTIFWGGSGAYGRANSTALPVRWPTSVTPGDYDGDGHVDLVVTALRSETSFETDSKLFLGSASGLALDRPVPFTTRAATDAVIADFDGDDEPDIAFANKKSGNAKGTVPSFVYLGSASGYSASRRLDLPSSGANEATFADFDDDGWTDVLVDNSDHDDASLLMGARIFTGGPDGVDPKRFTRVDVDAPWASSTADFNRDGYLDIVFSAVTPDRDALFVYWGSPQGYRREGRAVLPMTDGRATAVADLNLDGHLDIIGTSVKEGIAKIFWGGSDGFARDRYRVLDAIVPVSAEVADLNADGYPDIILCNFWRASDHHFGMPSYVYWGGPSGFTASHRTELPTYGAHDAAVADMNADGRLDIVFSNYRTDDSREPPSYIYWGGDDGFDPRRRSLVPAIGGAGMLAADLNRDGFTDLVFANHVTSQGDHRRDSQILWGSARGIHGARKTWLPGLGPHNMVTVDVGNRMTRALEEEYISSAHRAAGDVSETRLTWEGQTPNGTRLLFQVRTASTEQALEDAPWLGPEGEASYAEQSGALIRTPGAGRRFVQYRALLTTPDGGDSPLLRKVELLLR